MAPRAHDIFLVALEEFAERIATDARIRVPAQPEDQLKNPVQELLETAGEAIGRKVESRTETPVREESSRPDIGVAVEDLLTGHVELKAPGKGARPNRFRGADKQQWEKFKALPNLIYTDASEWSLFRSGDQRGTVIRLSGDMQEAGRAGVTSEDAATLLRLFQDFILWEPLVPDSPRALAEMLAPLCRLLREDVVLALSEEGSSIAQLAREWRQVLFPDADDAQFADAYAQTVTYALLLARLEGLADIRTSDAASALDSGHGLLAQTLRILTDPAAQREIGLGIDLLERVIGAVDPAALTRRGRDPWLYFYEDFLAAYDPKLRNDRGVYYTPAEVIGCQVRLVSQLLEERFDRPLSFAGDDVVQLDPAAGTGAYPLAAIQHGLQRVEEKFGRGAVPGRATVMASNTHAFEILVGPYAVAHLRLTQAIEEAGGDLPADGVHVYLTDTLESPGTEPATRLEALIHRRLADEHRRAQEVKARTPVLVCMGNPPYDRQQIDPEDNETQKIKGGWVRFGDPETERTTRTRAILKDFLEPAQKAGQGVHLKNLYNDYVYFWRWALWKVFETTSESGIVSFISASSYLRGPGFVGMRQVMRETFDDLWILDLEGDSLGARKTENVFNIQTPVAIAVGVRYGAPNPDTPARVRYAKITGTREEKLGQLNAVSRFDDLEWQECFSGWMEPFLPAGSGDYFSWPSLSDLFPWQHSGAQYKRTWPIGETQEVLLRRWQGLLETDPEDRAELFRETRDRKITRAVPSLDSETRLPRIVDLPRGELPVKSVQYGFRSFDRQWALPDPRVGDFMRPALWRAHGPHQIYITSLLTNVLGEGPAATVSAEIPDLHHFRGSFGGRDAIPLWRDAAATKPNITAGLLERLGEDLGRAVTAEELFAYVYTLLATPTYVEHFAEELAIPGPRIPLTKDTALFGQSIALGQRLLWLHTYGDRLAPEGNPPIPQGTARCTKAVPTTPEEYPETFSYDYANETLTVGSGRFGPVSPPVWEYSVSGLQVVYSWLSYRMKEGAGRRSSPLDDIRPERWTAEFTEELLRLLWILEATVGMFPKLAVNLKRVISSELFSAVELPTPTDDERQAPAPELGSEQLTTRHLEGH